MDAAPPAPRLLALRALKLGDLLVAVPAIRGLRRGFPDHRLLLAVPGWLDPIVRLIGGVDELVPTPGLDAPLPFAPGQIDVAVNLHGNGPESRGLIEALGARLVISHEPPGPAWQDGILERERWARLVRGFGIPADRDDVGIERPTVAPAVEHAAVVHVGAFYGSRRWPADRFALVARGLRDRGLDVVFTGSEAERPRAQRVAELGGFPPESVLAGSSPLDGLAAVIAAAAVVISADTGAAHLASAYRVPSVVLFGPAPPEEWGPPPGPHRVLTDASLRVGDTFGDEPDPALLAVGVADVLDAADEVRAQA